ncbi:MAG: hypothetical protein R2856_16915 [Caldilineaceae bacterium]
MQALIATRLEALGLAVDIVPTLFAELADHPSFATTAFRRTNASTWWAAGPGTRLWVAGRDR